MAYIKGPWRFEDSALVDKNGYEVIGIFEAHGDTKAWLTVGNEANQLLLEAAPDMYEALKEVMAAANGGQDFEDWLKDYGLDFIKQVLARAEGRDA